MSSDLKHSDYRTLKKGSTKVYLAPDICLLKKPNLERQATEQQKNQRNSRRLGEHLSPSFLLQAKNCGPESKMTCQ